MESKLLSRKFLLALLAVGVSTLAVAQGWIEGVQYVTIMTLSVGGYLAANVTQNVKLQA